MACYDDVNFIGEYLQHAVVGCDDIADFIFNVPTSPQDDDEDENTNDMYEDVEMQCQSYLESSDTISMRKSKRSQRGWREKTLGSNILEKYLTIGDDSCRDTLTIPRRLNNESTKMGRFGRGDKITVSRNDSSTNKTNATTQRRNKVITWSDDHVCDQEQRLNLLRPKDLSDKCILVLDANGEPAQSEEKNLVEKRKKSGKESAFIKALDNCCVLPQNAFRNYSKFLSSDGIRGRNTKEFNVYVDCDNSLEKDNIVHNYKMLKVRFDSAVSKVHDVIGLSLWMYQNKILESHKDADAQSQLDALPSENADDYCLKATEDDLDDPDAEFFPIDSKSDAKGYEWGQFVLQLKEKKSIERRRSSEGNSIKVDIHMLGRAVTKTISLTDRNTPLRFIYDEGMKFFFSDKPNYGSRYVLVPYSEQNREELDLGKTLSDFTMRSFLLKRSNSCSKVLIELEHVTSVTSNGQTTGKKLTKLATWKPDQLVEAEFSPSDNTVKLVVYLKPSNICVKMHPSSNLQDANLSHSNFRFIVLKVAGT